MKQEHKQIRTETLSIINYFALQQLQPRLAWRVYVDANCLTGGHRRAATVASGAQLTGSGTASVSADTLVLTTAHLEPDNAGLYFQADNGLSPGLAWGDGLRCTGGQLKRLQVRFANAAGSSATTIGISANAGNVTAGSTKRYQCWYRTTVNPPCGPGLNDFNSSNGYEVIWLP